MIRIGVTEAGDAGIDTTWVDKLEKVPAAVIITKSLTAACATNLLTHKDKCILHATITGFGGTVLEPNVPEWHQELKAVEELVHNGFPRSQVTIRVDPIIPTPKGIQTARAVMDAAAQLGFERIRVSIIDMYPHVRERFRTAHLQSPYGDQFAPHPEMVEAVDSMLSDFLNHYPSVSVESCAEKLSHAAAVGCVSEKDLDILHIPHESLDQTGFQRRGCLCCSGKTELLSNKHRCPNGCLYCYWK